MRRSMDWLPAVAAATGLALAPAIVMAGADAPRAGPAPPRTVLLAIDHVILQDSLAGLRAREDWKTLVAEALRAALPGVLAERGGATFVELPALEADEARRVGEHAALASLVVRVREDLDGAAWHARKEAFDHGFGAGLAFLKERAGADYGVVLTGWQVEHSPGAVATSLALGAAGIITFPFSGNRFMAGVFDLATGELTWSNAIGGAEVLGIGSPDLRDPEAAQRALARVFESYVPPAPAAVTP